MGDLGWGFWGSLGPPKLSGFGCLFGLGDLVIVLGGAPPAAHRRAFNAAEHEDDVYIYIYIYIYVYMYIYM